MRSLFIIIGSLLVSHLCVLRLYRDLVTSSADQTKKVSGTGAFEYVINENLVSSVFNYVRLWVHAC